MTENSLSRRSITCAECDEELSNQYNLKVHFQRNHPGKIIRAKGQSFLSFTPAPHKRLRTEGVDKEPEPETSNPETSNSTSDRSSLSADTRTSQDDQNKQSTGTNSQLVLEQIQSLLNTLNMNEKEKRPSDRRAEDDGTKLECKHEHDKIENRIKICASLKDIVTIMNETFFVDRVNDVLFCKTCIPNPENAFVGDNQIGPGVFSLQDVEYEKEKVQSRQLRRLKERLIKHLETQTHLKCDEKQKEEARIKAKITV